MSNAMIQDEAVLNVDNINTTSKVDFKMVTFSLGGKDYGVDIMKVKEISKAQKFTFVPNAAPFVKGVYNLRGDIISVVDLRIFFNLPVEENKTGIENMVILRLENLVMGVIVDSIDKVIGISSQNIQPPHPLFGDINIKYISGVVENDNRLYIILDVDRIFSKEKGADTAKRSLGVSSFTTSSAPVMEGKELDVHDSETASQAVVEAPVQATNGLSDEDALNIKFISETLTTFSNFYPSDINNEWIGNRYESWKEQRLKKDEGVQLQNESDSKDFLKSFYSPFTGQLWNEPYFSQISELLPGDRIGTINIWNPGCGNGYESYSLALIFRNKYKNSNIKILANDNDLISISTAPGLMVENVHVPEAYKAHLTQGLKGMQFSPEIKESIIFEYHDVLHSNNLPPLDFVFARDILSFISPEAQEKVLSIIEENIKPGGLFFPGMNERLIKKDSWEIIEKSSIICYRKK